MLVLSFSFAVVPPSSHLCFCDSSRNLLSRNWMLHYELSEAMQRRMSSSMTGGVTAYRVA